MAKETIASDDYILDMFEERFQDCGNLRTEGDAQVNDKVLENERIEDHTIVKETISNVDDCNIPMEQSMVVYDDIHEELRAKTQLLKKAKKKIQALDQKVSDLQIKFENNLQTIRKQNQQIKLTNQIIDKIQPLIGRKYNYSNVKKIRTKCYWDEENQEWHIPELVVQKKFPTRGKRRIVKNCFDDSSDEEFFKELEKIEEEDVAGPSFKSGRQQPVLSLEGSEPAEYDTAMDPIASSNGSPEISKKTFDECGKLMTECGAHSNDKGLEDETNNAVTKEKGLDGLNEPSAYGMTIDTITSSDDSSDISGGEIDECGNLTEFSAHSNDKGLAGESNNTVASEKGNVKNNAMVKSITCKLCLLECSSQAEYLNHYKIHSNQKQQTCGKCGKTFSSKQTLRRHLSVHSDERPYACEVCGKAFKQFVYLSEHLRCHTNEKPYRCKVCGKSFTKHFTWKQHLATHSDERPYLCEFCTKTFRLKRCLQDHLKTHTSDKPHKCDTCGKAFIGISDLKKHLLTHSEERPYSCKFCTSAFKWRHHLREHLRTHTNEKPHKCETCGKAFLRISSLNTHIQTHSNQKPYVCESCGKAFAAKGNLITHRRTHTKEKPYSCKDCGKSFTQWATLKQHSATHSEERPYLCEMCSCTFRMKHHLQSHLRTHRNERPHKCDTCGKAFIGISDLKKHVQTHSNERPFKCDICGITFKQSDHLKTHMSLHKKERPDNFTFPEVACNSEVRPTNPQYRIPWYDVCNLNPVEPRYNEPRYNEPRYNGPWM